MGSNPNPEFECRYAYCTFTTDDPGEDCPDHFHGAPKGWGMRKIIWLRADNRQ